MARLPIPGSDSGTWGDVLNEFLSQTHNADGTLKDGVISESKLDASAQTKLNTASSSTVSSVNGRTGAVTLTSTDVGLGNVNNTSDASKPVSTATQTALDGKAATSHTHATYLVNNAANVATLPDSAVAFMRVNIPDDGSPTSGWPDRYANYFNGTRTGYFNEYGEVRARPAKTSTVAMRAMGHASASSANILEIANSSASQVYLGVSSSQISFTLPVVSNSTISATNIGAKVIVLNVGDPIPGGTPTGTVILRR